MRTRALTLTAVALLGVLSAVMHLSGDTQTGAVRYEVAASDKGQGNTGGGNSGGGNSGGTGGDNGNNGGGNGGGTGGDNGNNGGGNGGGTGGDNGNNGGGNGGGTGGGNGNGGGGVAGSSDNGAGNDPALRAIVGRGLRQHSAVLDRVLTINGLHREPAHTYEFRHPNVHPAHFASAAEEEAWAENLHKVTCSMYRYLLELRNRKPQVRADYVDWIIERMANALGEDVAEVRAALLGYPHHHESESSALRRLTEEGCGRGPIQEKEGHAAGSDHIHEAVTTFSSRFTAEVNMLSSGRLAFRITENGNVFHEFGISHGAEMHLIAVRSDLQHFVHTHPTRDAVGIWTTQEIPTAAGTYWVFGDFVDMEGAHHTIRFEIVVTGIDDPVSLTINPSMQKRVGNDDISLVAEPYNDGIILEFHINDTGTGRPPFFESFLGEMAHGFLISPTGNFHHTHPSLAGDRITLRIPNGLMEMHRIFLQYQTNDAIHTATFDWLPEAQVQEESMPEHELNQ